jgi:serine/threonine-protein phosphatase 2A regulatory subunit B''
MYTASQKFFFFVDPHRRNAISIKKIAHCAIMQELQYLLRAARKLSTEINDSSEVSRFEQLISANWFSSQNALRIYTLFLELDKDQNGSMSDEF